MARNRNRIALKHYLEDEIADRVYVVGYDIREKRTPAVEPLVVVLEIEVRKPDQIGDEREYWLEELRDISFFEVEPVIPSPKAKVQNIKYVLTECAHASGVPA